MINPNTKDLKEGAEQDFLNCLTTFSDRPSWPALDLRAAPRAFGCTPLAPRTGTSTPGRRHLPTQAGQSTWEPCTEKAPRGGVSGKPASPASATAMQSGWFFQVPPRLSQRPVPASAAPAGHGGWLRDTGTRRGKVAGARQWRTAGALSNPPILQSWREKHVILESKLQTRMVPSTLASRCSAACPGQSRTSTRTPRTRAAT